MDEFDEDILEPLKDGKTHTFQQTLPKISFTHNTLRPHIDYLVDQKPVTREKTTREAQGRPKYVYSLSSAGRRAALMLRSGVDDVVVLPFASLGQVCRFEKGGFCKRVRTDSGARVCPQIGKWI
jgi:predicted ArsR family transcriptional regulator